MKQKVKLDIGCGANKKKGYIGIDMFDYPGVDHVVDLDNCKLPYPDGTVDEIYSSHFLEHAKHPIEILNESSRALKESGICTIIVPHYSNPYAKHFTHVTYWSCFSLNQDYLDYYCNTKITLQSVRVRFVTYGFLDRYLSLFFSKHLRVYEWLICPFIKAWEIEYVLRKDSKHIKNNAQSKLH